MVRIITGKAKGRKIEVPKNITRPLTDRIKTSIFDTIQHIIPESHVLDLFSGSGNFGIEALSRGASHATFIDSDTKATDLIKRNLKSVEMESQASVVKNRAEQFLKDADEKFDIVFADPPFPLDPRKKIEIFRLIPYVCRKDSIIIVRIPMEESLLQKLNQFELLHKDDFGVSIVGYYGQN